MNKIFLEDFTFQNVNWKIYTIDKNESLNFFNKCNKNNIDEKEINLIDTEINNCNYMNLSNKIVYSIMKDGCMDNSIEFLNIYDNKLYKVYNTSFNYRDCGVILYYCNEDDPFIVIQTSVYMDFQYIFYLHKKEIIKISASTADHNYYFEDIINTINNNTNNIASISSVNIFYKILFFGFNMNIGHHLWNEISGLYYFLENTSYHDKIYKIIIGPFDPFNIEYILKTKYNFKIEKFTDIFQTCQHFHYKNLTDIFPIFLNNFFIDKNIKNLLHSDVIIDDIIDDNNILEISIDIRKYRRYLINQDIFYINLIKNLLNDYENYVIKINFLGCFQTNINIIDINTNVEYIEQNNIVSNIIQNFYDHKNIIFKNFLGHDFFYIVNNTIKSKIFITTFGTSMSNLMNWIYNIKIIVFGPIEAYGWTFQQYDVLKNYNAIICPKEYILTNNGLQEPFDVNFNLYYNFFKNELNKILY